MKMDQKKFSIDPQDKEAIQKAKDALGKEKLDLFDLVSRGENSVSSTRTGSPFPDTTYVRRP